MDQTKGSLLLTYKNILYYNFIDASKKHYLCNVTGYYSIDSCWMIDLLV